MKLHPPYDSFREELPHLGRVEEEDPLAKREAVRTPVCEIGGHHLEVDPALRFGIPGAPQVAERQGIIIRLLARQSVQVRGEPVRQRWRIGGPTSLCVPVVARAEAKEVLRDPVQHVGTNAAADRKGDACQREQHTEHPNGDSQEKVAGQKREERDQHTGNHAEEESQPVCGDRRFDHPPAASVRLA